VISIIQSQLSELREKSFSELAQLPPYQGTKTKQNGKALTISIWKDLVNDGEIRIVVQVYRHLFFGVGRMTADGFRINSGGVIHRLSRRELYDFT
jgi:hypothetical protein